MSSVTLDWNPMHHVQTDARSERFNVVYILFVLDVPVAFLELIKWGHFGGHDKCIGTKTGSIREVNTIRYDMKTFIAPSKTDMLQVANLRRCPDGQKLLPVIIVAYIFTGILVTEFFGNPYYTSHCRAF